MIFKIEKVIVEQTLYKKLEDVCEEAGQLKTTLVERALASYFEEYDRKQALLKEIEKDN